MHDEDNKLGLYVSNKKGESWKAYGDAKLFEAENAENCKRLAECLQASADEVYKAFETGKMPDRSSYAAINLIPTLESALSFPNHQPAFGFIGGEVYLRTDIHPGRPWSTFINGKKHFKLDWSTTWVEVLAHCHKKGF